MANVPFTIDSRFLQEVWNSVFHFARKHCASWASADDCEELTQQAMLELFEKVHSGKGLILTCNLTTYVNGIVKNLAKSHARMHAVLLMSLPDQDNEEDLDPIDNAMIQESIKRWLNDDCNGQQLQEEVRRLVENMTEPCRSILWAFYWEGKSMTEIASENGYAGKDVAKSQKSRCMTKVKEVMMEIRNKLRS